MPEFLETVALNGDGYENLPEPTAPYYVIAREGNYLHKHTQIGDVLLRENGWPKTLGRVGYANGVFTWKGEKVPMSLVNQAHDFFARIYATRHAEAEVLITKHNDTGSFRLFVPFQRVSHAGVKSIYEPTHVSREYTVVGTIHSHCDFSAFHSGTDSDDASDMDGVHFTIGHVTRDVPEIVGMVAMNGKEFHYKDPGDIADLTWQKVTSPPWWDQYVFATGEAPLQKPRSLVSISDEQWQEFLGRALVTPKKGKWQPQTQSAHLPPQNRWVPQVSSNFGTGWKRTDWSEIKDWRSEVYGNGNTWGGYGVRKAKIITDPTIDTAVNMAEAAGVFDQDEWWEVKETDVDDVGFWLHHFNTKLQGLLGVLEVLETADPTAPVQQPKRKPRQKGRLRR